MVVTQARVRLDRFVHEWLGGSVGRRQLATMLDAGDVRVNGRRARKGAELRRGDEVVIHVLPSPTPNHVDGVTLAILHVDEAVVVVDKPPGVPSTIGSSSSPSIAAALLQRFPEMAAIDARRAAGLVHRLDTGTSGVLVAARTPAMHRQLRAAFASKRVAKEYLAVVHGRLTRPGTFAQALSRHPRSRGRMIPAPVTTRAWAARTDFLPLSVGAGFTLVRLRMRTGVTHQLRVHMAMLGHPIVGDMRYGRGSPSGDEERRWHYLHAVTIRFEEPALLSKFTAPLPAHWRPLFAQLGWPVDGDYG